MGLIYHDAKTLLEAHRSGVSFQRMVSVARQQLALHPAELRALRKVLLAGSKDKPVPLENYRFGEYAERFYREFLDAEQIETLDYSAYEGATITHDMNKPVPESLRGSFDAVIESGSLEHIFNFPVAMANVMMMAKTGGTVFLTTVANNLCGHGFYQFSPELMYRIFCPENGFEHPRVVFLEAEFPWIELTPAKRAYAVTDPANARARVGLLSSSPVLMTVTARKIRDVEPFVTPPQQSDYTLAWENGAPEAERRKPSLLGRVARKLPAAWMRQWHGLRIAREYSLSNRRFYKELP